MTRRLTAAQATIAYLKNQFSERDGKQFQFFAGCFGIFGHGNVAGLGQALEQDPEFRYYLARNEQAMVHAATAFAKASFRLRAMVCTSSIGPGATNMLTGAATATINRLPVLLLPGDIFARRNVAPVLQQLESASTQDISVNDCFKPVSRYWDRIQRPEQLLTSLPEAMRVLTSPSDTGAVTIAFPQDVQAEAFDFPEEFFKKKVWAIPRNRCDQNLLKRAAEWIRAAKKPLIVAGGGVLYSQASERTGEIRRSHRNPSLRNASRQRLATLRSSPTTRRRRRHRHSRRQHRRPRSRFNHRHRHALQRFHDRLKNRIPKSRGPLHQYKCRRIRRLQTRRPTANRRRPHNNRKNCKARHKASKSKQATKKKLAISARRWEKEVDRIYAPRHAPVVTQGEVIGAVNNFANPSAIMICAAGSLPGDLHKLWRTKQPGGYHMEYGYSCMGYEIAAGLGAKMACPDRDVYVLVGDGSYLMMSQEIVTAIQEGIKINIVLLDNHGFSSIGGLSRACGNEGMGTNYRYRRGEKYDGEVLPVDFAANAASLGAWTTRAKSTEELVAALDAAKKQPRTSVVVIETSYEDRVPGYESWWDVAIAEVSEREKVKAARKDYEQAKKKERLFF